MPNYPAPLAAAASLLAAFVLGQPAAAGSPSASLPPEQRASLNGILTTYPADAIATQRMTCMFGEEPDRVIKGRREGKNFMPDAADTCVAVLTRTAHDGHLPELYRTLLTKLGGNVQAYDRLPAAIGNAALHDGGQVDIGNGKQIPDVPPPLAFDAGFTVAYLKGDTRAAGTDPAKLKLVSEACLAVRQDAGTCFSVGYVYGARAYNTRE